MNWLICSLISCLFFGMGALLASSAAKTLTSLPTLMLYGTGLLGTALVAAIVKWKPAPLDRPAVALALTAGVCAGVAVLFQFVSFSKWNDKTSWIILIGALYPAVALIYRLCAGERFTLNQWLGALLAIAAIILISMPSKTDPSL